MDWVILTPISAIVSILAGGYLFYQVQKSPTGTKEAARVSKAINEGANAYLRVLYTALVIVAVILSIVLVLVFQRIWMAVAYILGAMSSAVAGYVGM